MLEQKGLDRIEFHYKCTILKGTVQQQLVAYIPSVGEDSVAIRHEPELKDAHLHCYRMAEGNKLWNIVSEIFFIFYAYKYGPQEQRIIINRRIIQSSMKLNAIFEAKIRNMTGEVYISFQMLVIFILSTNSTKTSPWHLSGLHQHPNVLSLSWCSWLKSNGLAKSFSLYNWIAFSLPYFFTL